MVAPRLALGALILCGSVALTACASGQSAQNAVNPVAGPTRACDPIDAAGVSTLAGDSDVVIEATLTGWVAEGAADSGHSAMVLSDINTLATARALQGVSAIKVVEPTPPAGAAFPLGRYLLFLRQVDGAAFYYIVNGLDGAIQLQSGVPARVCPNAADPSSPTLAPSSSLTIANLEAVIPSTLSRTPSAKPTATVVSSP